MKKIPGHPAYRADKNGDVWSTKKCNTNPTGKTKKLKPYIGTTGYLYVAVDGKTKAVHRLVLEAFIGIRPKNMVCCHNDGNKLNNTISNLRWDTRKANVLDMLLHGTYPVGEKNANSKLINEDILFIRRYPKRRGHTAILSKLFGVSDTMISNIRLRRNWTNVPDFGITYE